MPSCNLGFGLASRATMRFVGDYFKLFPTSDTPGQEVPTMGFQEEFQKGQLGNLVGYAAGFFVSIYNDRHMALTTQPQGVRPAGTNVFQNGPHNPIGGKGGLDQAWIVGPEEHRVTFATTTGFYESACFSFLSSTEKKDVKEVRAELRGFQPVRRRDATPAHRRDATPARGGRREATPARAGKPGKEQGQKGGFKGDARDASRKAQCSAARALR